MDDGESGGHAPRGDPYRTLLVRIAQLAYDDGDGRPPTTSYRDERERQRCIANGQWWWLDDRRTDIGSAEFFCTHVLLPARVRAEVAAILEARWDRLGILVPPRLRIPWPQIVRHLGRRPGSWPLNTGQCHGAPGTVRESCRVPVDAAHRRCPECRLLLRNERMRVYYDTKGRERYRERRRTLA